MNEHDFATVIDRTGEGASKWTLMDRTKPDHAPDAVPFSVADMEFVTPAPIARALAELAQTRCLGYTEATERYTEAVLSWQRRRHGWDPKAEWLVESAGVVPALFSAVHAFTEPGDGVVIQEPVYYPFRLAVENTGRRVVANPLVERGDGSYAMDLDDLAEKAADPKTRLLILCSPHNPVGRVWSREELRALADVCLANDVFVVADEIHNDLVMPGHEHVTFASVLSGQERERCLVCTAPSKTFNIAGLQCSNIFVPGKEARERFCQVHAANGFGGLNCFAYRGCEAAYEQCEGWLDGLLATVEANAELVRSHLAERWPQVRLSPLEGTYLLWVDVRALSEDQGAVDAACEAHDLFFDAGTMFGAQGAGFVRWNIACPRALIEAALPRLDAALADLAAAKGPGAGECGR